MKATESNAKTSTGLDMLALMAMYETPANPKIKSIVSGTVVATVKGGYLVSLGLKCDCLVRDAEPGELEVDKKYDFFVEGEGEEDGSFVLSYRNAAVWSGIKARRDSGEVVSVRVHSVARSGKTDRVGGVICFLDGIKSFIPRSELNKHMRFDNIVGTTIPVKVLSFDETKGHRGEIILSNAKASEQVQDARLAELKAGNKLTGKVVKFIEAGVLVDLGCDLTGLVRRSEVTGDRNANPAEHVKLGDDIEVKVAEVNIAKRQVLLSLRAAKQEAFVASVNEGDVLKGTIARFEAYGAFVRLGNCIDGLLHIADYDQNGGQREKLEVGNEIEVKVKTLDRERSRISLSRKGLARK